MYLHLYHDTRGGQSHCWIHGNYAHSVLHSARINAKLQSLSCSGLTKNDSSTPLLVSSWNRNQNRSPTDRGDEVEEKGDSPLLNAEFVSYLGQAEPVSGLNYEAEVSLQPLVFIFDKVWCYLVQYVLLWWRICTHAYDMACQFSMHSMVMQGSCLNNFLLLLIW